MKSQTFEHEMTETSSIFGRKKDIKVVFKGDGAATNGSTVYLPSLEHEKDVDPDTQMVMRGYVDHEAGHVRHSDMPLILEKYGQWEAEGKPLLKGLHNAIEDMWLEKRVMREYAGSAKNIAAVASSCNSEFAGGHTSGDPVLQSWGQVGPLAITWEGRREYEGITHVDECLDMIDPALAARVKEWVAEIDGCDSTADCMALAENVYAEIKTKESKEKEDGKGKPDERPVGPDTSEHESAERDADADGDERGDDSEPETGEDSEDTGDADGDAGEDGEDGEEDQDVGGEAEEQDEIAPLDTDLKSGMDAKLKLSGMTSSSRKKYRIYTTEDDRVLHRLDGTRDRGSRLLAEGSLSTYKRDVSQMRDTVSVMGRKLARAFMAKRNRDWDGGREYGRLDSRRLVAAVGGATHVFKMRSESKDVETAVQILCDMSGSMTHDNRIVMARRVAIALCETLERTTVAYEVLGFGTDERRMTSETRETHYDKSVNYARTSPMNTWVFKAFEERLSDCKAAIGTMAKHNMDHNIDGESVLLGHMRLKARPEKRQIMLVLSDGNPEFTGKASSEVRNQHLRDVIAHAQREGTEMIGIGIQTRAVQRFYDRYAVVFRLEDLAEGALDQLARLLIDDKFDVTSSDLIKARRLG